MTKWSDFELRREIGRGAFGTVFCAFHPTLRQEVALKLIPVPSGSPHDIDRALEEPRRLASVRHNHVVIVHDARYSDGHVGICMELIRGESLAQILSRRGLFGVDEAVSCGKKVCRALSAIHRAELVHNDVKAQNVMREDGGRIVLMDFGAGRSLRDEDSTTGMHFLGTPAYMAPELFGLNDPTPSSDLYSVGVLLFYLLTGRFPVEGQSLKQLAEAHANGTRLHLSDFRDDVPARVASVLDRALERRPEGRYRTPGELLEDLTARSPRRPAPRPASAGPDPSPAPAEPGRAVSALLVAGLMAAAVSAIWVVGFLTCKAYDVMFGLTGQFASDGPADWLIVGLRTLPLPVAYVIMAVTGFVIVKVAWRFIRNLSPSLDAWWERTAAGESSWLTRTGLSDPSMSAAALLIVQVLLLAAIYWWFNGFISAVATPLADGLLPMHARLSPANENEWLTFCGVTTALSLASGVGWATLLARPDVRTGGLAAPAGGLALTVVLAVMPLIPWRIVQQAEFQLAQFGTGQCFVLSQQGARVLLHCPEQASSRNLVVSRQDERLRFLAVQRNIFTTAPRSAAEGQ
jgi:Protein kinase domain